MRDARQVVYRCFVFPPIADNERFLWRGGDTGFSLTLQGLGLGAEDGIVVSGASVDGRSATNIYGLACFGGEALLLETCFATALVAVPEYKK
jgi:hypothetical protein